MDLSTWSEEDLRAGLAVMADYRKAPAAGFAPYAVAAAAWAVWNEALHPRDEHGKFAVSGTEEGRNIIDAVLHGKHDGMTQRSRATHLEIYQKLKSAGHAQYASHYWTAVSKAKQQKQMIHPRFAFGKANMALHTGDLSHLEHSAVPSKPAIAAQVPQFKTEFHFKVEEGAANRIRQAHGSYLQTVSTPSDRAIIAKYTGNWFSEINPDLRTGVLSTDERKNVEKLDAALRNSTTSENVTVGRTVSQTVLAKISKAGIGGVFQDPAFVSTRMNPNQGGIHIEVPKGSPGLYANSISKHPGEDEFLLPRESEFEIVKLGTGTTGPSGFVLRYLGSNKAANRPNVAASLTEVQVAITPPTPTTVTPVTHTAPSVPATHVASGYKFQHDQATLSDLLGPNPIKINGPHGSQPGQWYQLATGSKVYVKPMTAERAMNESGANVAYNVMGGFGSVPSTWVAQDGAGQFYLVSMKVDSLTPLSAEAWASQTSDIAIAARAKAAKLWAVDAILSHWDVVGLAYDNMAINAQGEITRIDTGGAMKFRAQGAEKDNWSPGGSWNEPWTMRGLKNPNVVATNNKPGTQTKTVFGQMTNMDAADALQSLRTHMIQGNGLDHLEAAWTARGMSANDVAGNLAVITERLAKIPEVVTQLMQNPSLKAAA